MIFRLLLTPLRLSLRFIFSCLFLISFVILFLGEGPFKYSTHGYSSLIPPDLLLEDSWYGVYFQDIFIGYSHYSMRVREMEEGGGYVLKNSTNLKMPLLGRLESLNMEVEARLGSNYSLEEGEFRLDSRNYFFTATLKKKTSGIYSLTTRTPSQSFSREVIRDREIINPLFAPISLNYIPLKKKLFYTFYDPVLNRKTNILLLNTGRMDIELDGRIMESYKIEMDVEGVKGVIFVDNHGRMLKEEFLGFTFVKEGINKLFKHDYFTAGRDFISYFSLPAAGLPHKEKLKYMKVKVEGIPEVYIKEDFNQRLKLVDNACIVEISRKEPEKTENLPLERKRFAKYLEEDEFIMFNTPLIRDTVNSIAGQEKDPLVIIEKISDWMDENIKKVPSITIPNTMDVLKLRQGDCGELSALMAGFLRGLGIPAYVNIGVVYNEGRFFYHAWVSAYVGEWIDTDPALNQLIADPTHIKLLTGLENQFELFKVISRIKIEILDYR